jgi:isoquinoline 1-oxidoreductase/isoquinoline 1-oxidoreductase beta subunit
MKTAVVVRPPQFGGRLESWNEIDIRQQPGVVDAFEIHSGIAIVADSYWEARKAANALDIAWEKGPLEGLDSEGIQAQLEEALELGDPHIAVEEGDMAVLDSAEHTIEAQYTAPFLAHNTMEPQNATALFSDGKCEMWLPSQGPDLARTVAAQISGLRQQDITINSTLLGGGFGRRAYVDFAGEVIVIAQRMPGIPVKLIWSREDDIQHDFYRPASLHSLKGALDADGKLAGWQHTIVCSSLLQGFAVDMLSNVLPSWVPTSIARSIGKTVGNVMAGRDPITSEGAHIPYSIPNVTVGQVLHDPGIPIGFWRSVGHSYNAFVVESFIDELTYLAGTDAADFRREYLQHKPRHLGVLELVLDEAAWGNTESGYSQGLAVHESFDSFAAMVVEVSVHGDSYVVEKVVAAVDCGRVVNPDIVRTQVQSAIVYGLGAATKDAVSIGNGRVLQNNFNDSPVIRINECPDMQVTIVDSDEDPTGIGEIGTPPVAPALANAPPASGCVTCL